ncbi:MAG: 4Fe-4S binding protein [Chloroflexi bacterium]|nr:4Fe-4S binding protein [Chloroflexota bacterium]
MNKTHSISAETGAADSSSATVVLLCGDLQSLDNGLDLSGLCLSLQQTQPPEVSGRVVPGLCHAPPGLFPSTAPGTGRVVLGLCSRAYAEREMHAQLRRAGLDPLGVEVVDLGRFCTPVRHGPFRMAKARLLLAAAVARARAYPGSHAENLAIRFPQLSQKMSRRALWALPPVRYVAVASVDSRLCLRGAGCDLCLRVCSGQALQSTKESILVNKARCDACGLCVSACPTGAVQLPGGAPEQFETQVSALLEAGPVALPQRGIMFLCRQRNGSRREAGPESTAASASWLPVEVPCAGMVPASWVLLCLARGTPVGVMGCDVPCPKGQQDTIAGRLDYCRQLLEALGASPDWVQSVKPEGSPDTPASVLPQSKPNAPVSLPRPGAASAAVLALATATGAPSTLSLAHPQSPFGTVDVRVERCTQCGLCAASCPTGALALEEGQGTVSLTFDASLCIACGLCAGRCPEAGDQALQFRKATDLGRLRQGRITLIRDEFLRCSACGAPIAPKGMVRRIAELLGDQYPGIATTVERYCPDCRVASGPG